VSDQLVAKARSRARAFRRVAVSGNFSYADAGDAVLFDALCDELEATQASLASREEQLGFTEQCDAHGRDYSETCGACSVSRNIARVALRHTNAPGPA
jgi:hypothetical protein